MLTVSNSQCRSTGLQRKVLALALALKAWSLLTSLLTVDMGQLKVAHVSAVSAGMQLLHPVLSCAEAQ